MVFWLPEIKWEMWKHSLRISHLYFGDYGNSGRGRSQAWPKRKGVGGRLKTVMLKWRDRESKKRRRRRKRDMASGKGKDGRGFRARRGVRPDINAADLIILFLVASPAAATSADCCISSYRDWDRLSAPFAEGGIRRPLSANVKCTQIRRATNDLVNTKRKIWVREQGVCHSELIVINSSSSLLIVS